MLTVSQDTPWPFCPPLFSGLKLHPLSAARYSENLTNRKYANLTKLTGNLKSQAAAKDESRHRSDVLKTF
jgi:hypothetical protein